MISYKPTIHLSERLKLEIDAFSENAAYQLLVGLRDARRLRGTLLELSMVAQTGTRARSVLVIVDPLISKDRIHEEWKLLEQVVRPQLRKKLSLAIRSGGEYTGYPIAPSTKDRGLIEQMLKHENIIPSSRSPRKREAYYEILRYVIYQWLEGNQRITIAQIRNDIGTSYPTISRALQKLAPYIVRHSNRGFGLLRFPQVEWARLLAVAENFRSTVRFADSSGQPRSPQHIFRRVQRLGRSDIAVGGVMGAKHYYPALDITGSPRFDLTVHAPHGNVDLSFVQDLDPALMRTEKDDEQAVLVVHQLHRSEPLFRTEANQTVWADPVECLLDLQEARLESQAADFVRAYHKQGPKE